VAILLGAGVGARAALPTVLEVIRSPRFHLHAVHWVGIRALHPQDLSELLDLPSSIPLIDLDIEKLARRVAGHARVRRCDALRFPPNRLLLRVVERVPIGRVAGRAEGVDALGAHFPLRPGEGLDLVEVHGNVRWAIPLLLAGRQRGIEFSRVEAHEPEDVRFRVRGSDIRFRTGTDADRALRDWERVRNADVLERYRPKAVDLRFRGSAVLRELRAVKQGGNDVTSRGADRRS
jgi:hypothetical protein